MKKLAKILVVGVAFLGAILALFYLNYFAWPEVSDDVKKTDCIEAIKKVQFRETVFAQAERINELNQIFSNNHDKILLYNHLKKEPKNNPQWTSKIDLHLKELSNKLPPKVASSVDSILSLTGKELIAGIQLSTDESIMYSIYDNIIAYKPRNYRVYHNLYFNKKIQTVSSMGDELQSLIKDTLDSTLKNTQYTIKIEPYMGW